MKRRQRIGMHPALAVVLGLLAFSFAACSEDEIRYSDERIVDKLNLEPSESGYTIKGDPFCEVEGKLLNDLDEVQEAADRDKRGFVLASREGNVGVKSVLLAPDCEQQVKKKLNKLDPKPPED